MTGVKYPMLCLSHTLKTAATIRCNIGGASAFTASFPAAVYWTDPNYGAQASSATSVDLLHLLAYQFDVANGGAYAERPSWSPFIVNGGITVADYAGFFPNWDSGEVINLLTTDALTNAGGREIVRRLGGSQVTNDNIDTIGLANTGWAGHGMWMPGRGESGDLNPQEDGRGSITMAESGTAYGNDLGNSQQKRKLTFRSIEGYRVHDRIGTADTAPNVCAFQRTMLYLLQRGERIRYYSDYSATRTYLTSAMTTTSTTAVVASATGILAGQWIYINGEYAKVSNVASLTLTLYRPDPVAHAAYDPVSTAFMATYALDKSGGEISLESFTPTGDGVNDLLDFSLPLLRTT